MKQKFMNLEKNVKAKILGAKARCEINMLTAKEKGINAVAIEVGILAIGVALLLVLNTDVSGLISGLVQKSKTKLEALIG